MKVAVLFKDPSENFMATTPGVIQTATGHTVAFTEEVSEGRFLYFTEEFGSYEEARVNTATAVRELERLANAPLQIYLQPVGANSFICRDAYIVMLENRVRALDSYLARDSEQEGLDEHLERANPFNSLNKSTIPGQV